MHHEVARFSDKFNHPLFIHFLHKLPACLPVFPTPVYAILIYSFFISKDKKDTTLHIVFALSLLISSALLFWIQPLFAKMMLPLLGGSPAVWNTCMVFYQLLLLGGYFYAHLLTRYLPLKRQIIVQGCLLLTALCSLPIRMHPGWMLPTGSNPVPWIFAMLSISIGLPFFALSANAPLLQHWFSKSIHKESKDPYFLYSASNFGSLAALLSFPLILEPNLRLMQQSWFWSAGYSILIILLTGCAAYTVKTAPKGNFNILDRFESNLPTNSISITQHLHWLFLALIPSGLLLGVTTHLTADIASVPLLWVFPLSLYLLSFIIVFSRKPIIPHQWMLAIQPILIVLVLFLLNQDMKTGITVNFSVNLFLFFVTCMVCHGELAKSRPAIEQLTEFYLWISLGGALGGLSTALLAPMIFSTPIEYPLAILLACFLRPAEDKNKNSLAKIQDTLWPISLALLLPPITVWAHHMDTKSYLSYLIFTYIITGMLCFHFRKRPIRFGLCIGSLTMLSILSVMGTQNIVIRERNFFGTVKVATLPQENIHQLILGTTIHGAQRFDPDAAQEPLMYFSRSGPLGQVFEVCRYENKNWHIAILGLGAGAIAWYGKEKDEITFYEINPLVEQYARDQRYFTYLHKTPAKTRVILGDGRLSLTAANDQEYDLLIMDAFSSDAMPIHLLTREAMNLYLAKLKPNGLMVFNITNLYVNIKPVLEALARNFNLKAATRLDNFLSPEDIQQYKTPSEWVVITHDEDRINKLLQTGQWKTLPQSAAFRMWTDDWSNIISVLK